jgi:NAD(P)-dependent dehydrogenase (short-subunit alcohol dehydrogenase family)
MGKRLVPILLSRGDIVIATARSLTNIQDFPKSENLRLQQLDVTDGAGIIKSKVDEAVGWYGRIDVVVNNAGIGAKSFTEEGGRVF